MFCSLGLAHPDLLGSKRRGHVVCPFGGCLEVGRRREKEEKNRK